MKKLFLPVILLIALPASFSCSSSKLASYTLNESDAAAAIRQLLELGTRDNLTGAFSKDMILTTLFPAPVAKALNTLHTLGLTSEVDRFTNTLSTAAEKAATSSIPIFVNSIDNLKFSDAMRIIKTGGTAATDYLKFSTGDNVRKAIAPAVQAALDEYKLNDQWNKLIKPVKALAGNKLDVNLTTVMSALVTDAMFKKIAEKEIQVRADANARTTNLLQKVFSKSWN